MLNVANKTERCRINWRKNCSTKTIRVSNNQWLAIFKFQRMHIGCTYAGVYACVRTWAYAFVRVHLKSSLLTMHKTLAISLKQTMEIMHFSTLTNTKTWKTTTTIFKGERKKLPETSLDFNFGVNFFFFSVWLIKRLRSKVLFGNGVDKKK